MVRTLSTRAIRAWRSLVDSWVMALGAAQTCGSATARRYVCSIFSYLRSLLLWTGMRPPEPTQTSSRTPSRFARQKFSSHESWCCMRRPRKLSGSMRGLMTAAWRFHNLRPSSCAMTELCSPEKEFRNLEAEGTKGEIIVLHALRLLTLITRPS
jgi:hypothetical protein